MPFRNEPLSPNEAALAAVSEQTDWGPLIGAFEYVLRPGLFEFDNPRQELRRLILRLRNPDEYWTAFERYLPDEYWNVGHPVSQHQWTPFERDCLRWAKVDEVLDRGVPWDDALGVARKELWGHSAAGERGTLQRAYQTIRNLLPETMQRPRRPRGPNRK